MRWVTYFPEIHNVHLTKDLGLLPYYMQHVVGYDAALMARFTDLEYPALEGEMKGLKTISLNDRGTWFFTEKASAHYLRKNAKKIDVLNLYHLSRHTLIYGYLYKKNNRRGKLYLKLDAYTSHLKNRKTYSQNPIKNRILKWVEKRFFNAVDFISVENTQALELAKITYPQLKEKLFYLPNGCNDLYLKKHFPGPFTKKNILLSVGRPGSADKNYELLLAALPFLKTSDWQIRIAGEVTPQFFEKWKEAAEKYPEAAAKISFLGHFTNRQKLYEEYASAKVFFLPSRVESFGIAYVEAMYFGNVIVGHKHMSAFDDLSANGKYGEYFDDNNPESFAKALQRAMEKSSNFEIQKEIQNHTEKNFYWSAIAKRLGEVIS